MLSCKSAKFSLPQSEAYLNCAYMSPLLKSVEKVGLRGVRLKRNPAEIRPEDFFTAATALRTAFSRLINAESADQVAIIPSASYGIATVTRNVRLSRGENVIVAAEQFPSNFYPWQSVCADYGAELRVVGPPGESYKDRGKLWNSRLIESINPKTKAVAIGHVHWADGTLFDLEEIRKRTLEVGALLIVDGTQSVGALTFDVKRIRPDALICAAYKWLLGPYSIGLAYYGEYFNDGKPIEDNWINRAASEDFSALVSYEAAYKPGAARFSVGEQSNFILVPMALKGISQINRWHTENIQAYCKSLAEPAIERLREKDFIIEELPFRASHLFGIRHSRQWNFEKLRAKLIKHKVHISVRGDAIRVSPHVYNRAEHMNKLVKVLTESLS